MPKLRNISLLLVAALVPFTLFSRAGAASGLTPDYLVHVWQTDNGLPQNWVSSIEQTPDGYLWVGTRYGGLARFDGVRFVPFNPQNTPAIKDVQVEFLSLDETGRLWVIMGNESITVREAGRFELYRWPRALPRLRASKVLNVHSNQILFASEASYLISLDTSTGTNGWSLLMPPSPLEPDYRTFLPDQEDAVWSLAQRQQLVRYSRQRYEVMSGAPGLPDARVTALATDARQRVWVATPGHLLEWIGQAFEDRTPTNGPPPGNILQMAFSGDGGLWVLERNRLRKYADGIWSVNASLPPLPNEGPIGSIRLHGDAQGGVWLIRYGHGLSHTKANGVVRQLTERDGIPSHFITCWFQDNEGDVWLGTAGGGVVRIRESVFTALTPADGLPGKVVRSVCVDRSGDIWAGTMSAGVSTWKDGAFNQIALPVPNANPVDSVTVCPDRSGRLWIGSLNHGLMFQEAGRIQRVNAPGGPGPSIRVLFIDSKDQLWVGGLVNLYRYEDGRFNHYGAGEGFADSHAIGAIAEDADGALWIGTGPGDLWKFANETFTRFTPPSTWPSVRFSSVLADTNGVVWVGTLGGGLLRFQDGQFTRCTIEHGLPDNNISQLLDSGDGHLWAGTYAGIFRASKTDLAAAALGQSPQVACRVYGRFDGLPALECSSGFQPSCWRADDGRLWFSTANGLVSANPLEVSANRKPPVVIIEELLVNGKAHELPQRVTPTSKPLQIQPGRHYVQFRFTGLNFAAPDGVRFRVKLESVDADWQDVASQRSIGYGPLQPGSYRFRVIACNNDGVWNEAGDSLAFVVQPYFWETWWFRALLALVLFSGLGLTVALAQRRRYRRKLDNVERQRATERERTRIAQDLHDDLGTSLTQISMLSALANREQTPPAEARELIEQVRGRAREMVTALDEIVWAVNPRNDSLRGLINYLGHFAEEFFRPTGIRCRLDLPNHLPEQSVSADLRHHLFLAFKEAVNNAARHSGADEVEIRSHFSDQQVSIDVVDHGHGFERKHGDQLRVGNGLANMQKRMEQAGGRAEVKSNSGRGTIVSFHLPLKRN